MSLFAFSKEDHQKLEEVNVLYDSIKASQADVASSLDKSLADFWSYLQTCESYHLNETYKTDGYIHDMENMLSLFIINVLVDEGYLTSKIRDLGLPKSQINMPLTDGATSFESILESILDFLVAEDGTLYFMSKYCQLDVMWTVVLLYYAFYKYIYPKGVHPFVVKPQGEPKPTLPPLNAKIAIIGDWGTGAWKDGKLSKAPAQLVVDGVEALKPDYVIHLGDVYYAGTSNEERRNLVGLLKDKALGKLYTMNSNHEMYDGANGLYKEAIASGLFPDQLGRTFFSIDIGDWILVGLDSAYFDDSALYMDGSLYKDKDTSPQYKFLNAISKQGKPILLMTHHNGIGIKDHKFTVNTKLWNQVTDCLDGNMPDLWYWGHVHNGIVYNTEKLSFPDTKIPKSTTGKIPQFRCCGHASIPFGNGSGFYTKEGGKKVMRDELEYYAHTPLNASDPTLSQRERVLNGFAVIDINGSEIIETFYEVSNANPKPKAVWSSK